METNKIKYLIIIGVIVFLIVYIVVISIIVYRSIEKSSKTTNTSQPTNTPQPTDTPKPTIKPLTQLTTDKTGISSIGSPPGLISPNNIYSFLATSDGGIILADNKNNIITKNNPTTKGPQPYIINLDKTTGHLCILDANNKPTWCYVTNDSYGPGPWTLVLDNNGALCSTDSKKITNWCIGNPQQINA